MQSTILYRGILRKTAKYRGGGILANGDDY